MSLTIFRFSLMAVFLFLSACATTEEKSLAQGEQAFKAQHYVAAFEKLYPLAQSGNAQAQYAVGYILYYGQGGLYDKTQGMRWISAAAAQGNPLALEAWQLISQNER